jgi:hypothetical protein
MEDWKTRLADEYRQTKERYEKLKAYNNKKEVEKCIHVEIYRKVEDSYDDDLRRGQQRAMGEYLHILELRMELHGITI